jgi:glutathione S-transferase
VAALGHVKVEEIILNEEEAKSKETKAKVLTGKFPFLETDHGVLFESGAIASFLAEKSEGAKLLGANDFETAQVNQWVDYATGTIYSNLFPIFRATFGYPGVTSDQYTEAVKNIKENAKLLNTHLQGKDFLVGSTITVADVVVFMALSIAF